MLNWPPTIQWPPVGQHSSDVKRGQNFEAETEAEARALRPRPELWGQSRGQFLEVEAKAEAKDKVMSKKYQMTVDNTGEYISLWSKWHSWISYSLAQ